MKKTNPAQKSSAQVLLEVIQDMHAAEQVVTREVLFEHGGLAGMTKTQIDDRLSYLETNGLIVRVQRGVFVPMNQHRPARPIYHAICPDGTHVLEIGDDHKLILTPREARNVGQIMAGAGQQFVAIEIGHATTQAHAQFATQMRDLRRSVGELQAVIQGAGVSDA